MADSDLVTALQKLTEAAARFANYVNYDFTYSWQDPKDRREHEKIDRAIAAARRKLQAANK